MEKYINYYYDLYPFEIETSDKYICFSIGQDKYYLLELDRTIEELKVLYNLNLEMIKRGSLVHEIIPTKNKELFITVEITNYVLVRVYVNSLKVIDSDDILFMLKNNEGVLSNIVLNRMNWEELWSNKVDYFEYHTMHIAKKNNILYKTLDYYVGLAENAISYVKEIKSDYKPEITVSHKRVSIDYTLFDLYNPLNFIIDYSVRDICEYIKMLFFSGKDVWSSVDNIFINYRFSSYSLKLLFARLLYPSYYFDMYDDIIINNLDEKNILKIVNRSNDYEMFLNNMYKYLRLYTDSPKIEWIIKK